MTPPTGMKAGVRSQELIQNTDFVPTWFELAGAKPAAKYRMDGVSLVSLFQEPHKPVRKHVYAEIGAARSIKTKTHSYIALRYTREQVAGVRESHRRYLKSLTGQIDNNQDLQLTIDGTTSGTIKITGGPYSTTTSMASALETAINSDNTLAAAGI